MVFEKKLIILSGEKNAKGTLSLERNAFGVFASLNLYNLPDLRDGEYCAGLRSGVQTQERKLGGGGRILTRFTVEEMDFSAVHCVIYDTARETPILYGCNTPAKLWAGNMMDGFGRKRSERRKEEIPQKALPSYSERPPQVKDYFFDIYAGDRIALPDAGPQNADAVRSIRSEAENLLASARSIAEYNDSALAEVNYYERGPSVFSGRDSVDPDELLNPVDRAALAEAAVESAVLNNRKEKTQPWEYERAYLSEGGPVGTMAAQPRSLRGGAVNTAPLSPEAAFTIPPASVYTAADSAGKNRPASVFYEQIKTQLDGLFSSGERFELLEELMPETRWVKIQYDDVRYYAVGLVGSRPDYICYGVPAAYSPEPPSELGDNCRWLPESPASPKANGFWLLFQDALTGEPMQD